MPTPTSDKPGPRVAPTALSYGLAVSSVVAALLLTALAGSDYLFAQSFFLAVILRTEDALARALEMTPTGA